MSIEYIVCRSNLLKRGYRDQVEIVSTGMIGQNETGVVAAGTVECAGISCTDVAAWDGLGRQYQYSDQHDFTGKPSTQNGVPLHSRLTAHS